MKKLLFIILFLPLFSYAQVLDNKDKTPDKVLNILDNTFAKCVSKYTELKLIGGNTIPFDHKAYSYYLVPYDKKPSDSSKGYYIVLGDKVIINTIYFIIEIKGTHNLSQDGLFFSDRIYDSLNSLKINISKELIYDVFLNGLPLKINNNLYKIDSNVIFNEDKDEYLIEFKINI